MHDRFDVTRTHSYAAHRIGWTLMLGSVARWRFGKKAYLGNWSIYLHGCPQAQLDLQTFRQIMANLHLSVSSLSWPRHVTCFAEAQCSEVCVPNEMWKELQETSGSQYSWATMIHLIHTVLRRLRGFWHLSLRILRHEAQANQQISLWGHSCSNQ